MAPQPGPASVTLSTRALDHLRRIIQAIHTQSAAIEAATGLSGPQFWGLREVARARDGITVGELARRLALHKANASRLADRLARKRLVTRETPPEDRRVVLVRVTAAGLRKAAVHVSVPPQAHLLARLNDLPAAELAAIEGVLGRLVQLLGADAQEPAPLFEAGAAPEGEAPASVPASTPPSAPAGLPAARPRRARRGRRASDARGG